MTKNVQQQGGDAESENQVIGLSRQLRIDTSNQEIRLHDGSTVGGRRFLNRDANDGRYQTRSTELDGLDFDSLGIGFLVRLAPADYRLRALELDSDAFDIVNSAGIDGNPSISLKASIAGARTFTGSVAFTSGLTGAHTGTSTGTHTGLQIGPVTGDVTGDLLGDTFGTHTGALDVTGAAVAFDPGQIPLSAINQSQLLAYVAGQAFEPGMIMQWFGVAANVPAGWLICDGSNGTPNMLGRFAYGATNDSALGTAGGTLDHTHILMVDAGGSHNHPVTVDSTVLTVAQIPAHKHGNGVCDAGTATYNHGSLPAVPPTADSIDNNSNNGVNEGYTTDEGEGLGHDHSASSGASGSHIHLATASSAQNLPPYRALYFIMKGN